MDEKKLTYAQEQTRNNTVKLRELCDKLPKFIKTYLYGIEQRTGSRTRIAYAGDLKTF